MVGWLAARVKIIIFKELLQAGTLKNVVWGHSKNNVSVLNARININFANYAYNMYV